MQVVSKSEARIRKVELLEKMEEGIVFIHPTDTIYGLGCDATNEKAVAKIRDLKKREKDPFSIIAPSKEWIEKNCDLDDEARSWVDQLPGPYTLILKLKNEDAIASNVNPSGKTIGVRIPDHWISEMVEDFEVPIVTTSANQTGKEFMVSIENLDPSVKKGVGFAMYEGDKRGRPSKIVKLTGEGVTVRER